MKSNNRKGDDITDKTEHPNKLFDHLLLIIEFFSHPPLKIMFHHPWLRLYLLNSWSVSSMMADLSGKVAVIKERHNELFHIFHIFIIAKGKMIENLANGWKYKNCQSFFNILISFIQFKLVGGGGGGYYPRAKHNI